MKTKTFAFMAIPALAAIMFVGAFAPTAMAGGPADPDEAADVQHDDGCNPFVTVPFGFGSFTPIGQNEVHTNNANGNSLFSCTGVLDDLDLAPDRAFRATFDCTWSNPETGDVRNDPNGRLVISDEGDVKITCHDR